MQQWSFIPKEVGRLAERILNPILNFAEDKKGWILPFGATPEVQQQEVLERLESEMIYRYLQRQSKKPAGQKYFGFDSHMCDGAQMEYCESSRDPLYNAWDRGFSICFFDTFCSMQLTFFMSTVGIRNIVILARRSSAVTATRCSLRSLSALCKLQLALHVFMIVCPFVELAIYASSRSYTVHGHHLVKCASQFIVWSLALVLLCFDLRYRGFKQETGHCKTLLIFLTLHILFLSFVVFSYNNVDWWWHMTRHGDVYLLALFNVKYVIAWALFFITVHAPGIVQSASRCSVSAAQPTVRSVENAGQSVT
ncbi:unnamed protein product [Soboliphyme baturini]|uniref:MTABC_N domain-containing protein n=1 Tax=Soboliphyme baturini TaxID=241478 RepID=A0A183IJG1_9BILA|nr:unnamed protein product [Soboliphyme baturini]